MLSNLHVHVANMATAKGKGGGKQKDKEAPSAEQIVAKFQQMRNEQRAIVSKIAELETDRGEHKWAWYKNCVVMCLFLFTVD